MTSPNLERLARAGELKSASFTRIELLSQLAAARALLAEARHGQLSRIGRFGLACGAAHSAASVALGLHGYRCGNPQLVFQCLEHTTGLAAAQCRLFALAQERRNRAGHHGQVEIEAALLDDLLRATENLVERVAGMVPPG